MTKNKFRGTGVAIVTPFKNGAVDLDGMTAAINHVIKGGVQYIVALGSTGEAATLDADEGRKILDHVIEIIDGRLPLVAGNFGDNNTGALCNKIKKFNFSGIDAILSASPAYVKPSQEGIFRHYMAMADVSPVPIILYNVPGRTRSNMEWDTTIRLAHASKTFIGIKEASGDLIQTTKIVQHKPDNFFVTSGDDEVTIPMIACGAEGVISVIANAFPLEFSMMINSALDGDFALARDWNYKTYDLHKWLYIEGNPVGIKSAMEIIGICTNEVRLPLTAMTTLSYNSLKEEILKTNSRT